MKKYFPILLSKAGELTALSHLSRHVKDEVVPIIQMLSDDYNSAQTMFSTEWTFDDNELYLDFSLCAAFDKVLVRHLIINLVNSGVNVTPVIQHNSSTQYIALVENLIDKGHITNICIRFSNSSGGFININNQLDNLLTRLGVNRNQTSILLDFGFVDDHNYNTIAALAISIISGINHRHNYRDIIISSGSFLENLSSLTPAGRLYRLQRYEWDIWLALQSQQGITSIKYSDYGTKYPYYTEANFQGTCSIKYTVETEFIIYRGEISGNHKEGNGQYIIFADRLVRSADYSGAVFSWGDGRIDFFAHQILTDPNRKTGNAKSWVEISQNHHITLLHSLL